MITKLIIISLMTYVITSFYIGLIDATNIYNYKNTTGKHNTIFFPSWIIINFFQSID